MAEPRRPLVVGVAGGSGSGKTTVVRRIMEALSEEGATHLRHDSYYKDFGHLSEAERDRINFDHPDALETSLLVEHLGTLLEGRAVETPVYDFRTHLRSRESTVRVEPTGVVLVDGILVLAEPDLRALLDIKVYVDTDADIRFIRRLERDVRERGRTVDAVIRQYVDTVRPMHLEFVEPSKRWADVIVPEGGHNRVAVDMLATKLGAILARI